MSMLALLLGLTLDLTAAAPQLGPIVVVPGKQLGCITLGMSAQQLSKLGATTEDGQATLGQLTATLDQRGRVKSISAHLDFSGKPRLVVGGKPFQLVFFSHTARHMVKRFSGCRKPRYTGDEGLFQEWRCDGVRVEERLADGDPELTIEVR